VTPLDIRSNLELNPWDDLAAGSCQGGRIERIGLLPNATNQGRPSVAILVRLEDGTTVAAETTWALIRFAVNGLEASPVAELDRMEHP
jgi:hypothetical protein